jgi:hypothetical protein
MTEDELYLHDDEWGMIELLPRENYAERKAMVAEASAQTDLFVAPAAEVSIDIRNITLAAFADLLGPEWMRCARVTSGYSADREDCANAFAFRPIARNANENVFYGTCDDERITDLFITDCGLPIMPALQRLGTTFQLMVCDLWQDVVVDLADPVALAGYVPTSDDE